GLGPKFPADILGPHLLNWARATVVSFGKNYELQLPTSPSFWSETEPDPDQHCVLMCDSRVFFRANCSRYAGRFTPSYVNIEDGIVYRNRPPGIPAYAIGWEILTDEGKPRSRTIVQYSRNRD